MKIKTLFLATPLMLSLAACGGGSGSDNGGSASNSTSSSSSSAASSSTNSSASSSSSASTSSSSSSSSNSSSSSSSSSAASSSSGSTKAIPNASVNGFPYCRISGSDPDGDGWGWENAYSCIVFESVADQGPGNFDHCKVGADELTLCESDNGSWRFENTEVCLSTSLCPGMVEATEQSPINENLVNANADSKTEAVYDYLRSIWGQAMLSGQQDLTWRDSIDMAQRVFNDTGKFPAILGYDYMNYTRSYSEGITQTEEAIVWWNAGGLVTFAWHWRDPSNVTDAFYSATTDNNPKTDFVIPLNTAGELDTASPHYAGILADIDTIAEELQKLEDEGVAVLWRPLHEASGGWFWWGQARSDDFPAAYAQVVMWRFLYDRLTDTHGLNNLIWVWNGQSAVWYPGDDYVDIASQDIYDGAQNYESQVETYNTVLNYPQQSKLIALSENSNIPDPDAMQQDGAWWLYFVVWNDSDTAEGVTHANNFWTGEHYNTQAHKNHVYNHSLVITRDELPDF